MISFEQISKTQFENDCPTGDYDKIKLPVRATNNSAGYDFYMTQDVTLSPKESTVIPTGIRWYTDGQFFLMIVPRSGLGFKYQLGLANTVGIIDADYYNADNEGHIMVKLVNNGDKPVSIKHGERFCQGIIIPYLTQTYDSILSNNRTGGFGSSDELG